MYSTRLSLNISSCGSIYFSVPELSFFLSAKATRCLCPDKLCNVKISVWKHLDVLFFCDCVSLSTGHFFCPWAFHFYWQQIDNNCFFTNIMYYHKLSINSRRTFCLLCGTVNVCFAIDGELGSRNVEWLSAKLQPKYSCPKFKYY